MAADAFLFHRGRAHSDQLHEETLAIPSAVQNLASLASLALLPHEFNASPLPLLLVRANFLQFIEALFFTFPGGLTAVKAVEFNTSLVEVSSEAFLKFLHLLLVRANLLQSVEYGVNSDRVFLLRRF